MQKREEVNTHTHTHNIVKPLTCVHTQWKEHERELMEEENRRILEFSNHQQLREEARKQKAKLQGEAMAAVQEKVHSNSVVTHALAAYHETH